MNKLIYIIGVIIITICMLAVNVYAYENSTFKIDLPSDYKEMSYEGLYMFVKSEDSGIVIYSIESEGLKKDLSSMSESEVEELIDGVLKDDINILQQKKEKLGNAKAIKARAENDDSYLDMYIVVSDKHILLIAFTAASEAELDSEEYLEIKDSFEMKEKTTNTTLINVGIAVVAAIALVLKFRRKLM